MRELSNSELDQVSGGAKPSPFEALLTAFTSVPYTDIPTMARNVANAMPEFPNAKAGSWQAKFNTWEDNFEQMLAGAGF